ncbi:hypothetical protein BOSEA31B_13869 [Hyphomicrobiales bacterium]|nr:hypothetical protein BOSEA31B_13869 [Hyphomicrobiales bacterium]CAH1699644.1 hypothetical protein BOSEA1005_12697 [Hyphomicrobiales bacterium]CAI0343379.1 hypothetical protein BO1005MUT1_240023 [Hyphomicrobiales bacterium]
MLSLDAAFDKLVESATLSKERKNYQTTTSLAPELGLREMEPHKRQRAYERHDGGRSLLLAWRQSDVENDHPHSQHRLTMTLLEEGVVSRRHVAEFEA